MNLHRSFIEKSEDILREEPNRDHYFVLYLDITDFQYINHCYGTDAGDRLLEAMEHFLRNFPGVTLFERLHSDYFLCLMSDKDAISDEQAEFSVGRRLYEFSSGQQKNYPACRLKIACGICRLQAESLAITVGNANLARKESKRLDSGRAVFYSEALAGMLGTRYEMEQSIQLALREGRFCFYLQPKVDLTNGRIVGAEALARLSGENGDIIYPDRFLPVMESSGTVTELDLLICRKVCGYLADRIARGLPVVRTSVNLSRFHIRREETAGLLHSIAEEYRIPPALIEFELTETILLEELSGAKKLIDRLRAYGYRVSIDEFGSGYAGINLWQELDFDCLKLDGRFLSDNPVLKIKNEALVPNLINIGQRLGVSILCEGVETDEQCRYLTRLGCTVVQGFYFSPPVDPDQFYDIYRKQNGSYPLPFHDEPKPSDGNPAQSTSDGRIIKNHGRRVGLYIPIFVCALFVGLSIVLATLYYQNLTREQFDEMAVENLDAYINGQTADIRSELGNVAATLETLSALISGNRDQKLIDAYLVSLNENDPEGNYTWLSAEDVDQMLSTGRLGQEDIAVINRLKEGETVVSNIVFSKRLGEQYYYAIAAPVILDGALAGTLRSTVNAKNLTSTSLFAPSQGSVIDCFITDGGGNIIPAENNPEKEYGTLSEYIQRTGIRPEKSGTAGDGTTALADMQSRKIGNKDGSPIYISSADLGYNDWHFTVLYRADRAAVRSDYIIRRTVYCTIALFLALILANAVILIYMRKLQKKFSMEQRRYMLLEQFSDTVLFDYDCKKDTIRFTPNADRLFRIHHPVKRDFLKSPENGYIYAGDLKTFQMLLNGQSDQEEVRIRLHHPSEDRYFWCLTQFRKVFEKGTLVSVVGKITDIDEQKLHEDYLISISEKDGLTGLHNKASIEDRITGRIKGSPSGILFMLDVDNFKQINDQYGHAAGDKALLFLADCMRKTFRSNDILGRVGGDELLAYMDGVHDRDVAQRKVELLMYYLRQSTSHNVPFTSISIGIAFCPDDGRTYEDLFSAADQAMYTAKNKGKHQFQFYDDI